MNSIRPDRKPCEDGIEPAGHEPLPTIEQGAHRIGDIESTGTIRIRGHAEGDIRASRIIVTAGAAVDGALIARTVHVDGCVNGPIVGDRVSLGPSARVKGNITYDALRIATGASVTGFCHDRAQAEPSRRAAGDDDSRLALPYSRARATCGKSGAFRQMPPPEREPVTRVRSMKAVWQAYEQSRNF